MPLASRSGLDLPAMDASANPCDDFYQYACGGWIKAHPTPPDQPRYGRFNELQDRNVATLRDILDEAAKPAAPAEQRKIGDYYASCMAEADIDRKGTAPLLQALAALSTDEIVHQITERGLVVAVGDHHRHGAHQH